MLLLDFFFTKIKKKLVIVALFCMFTRFYTFFIDITAMRKDVLSPQWQDDAEEISTQ